jgi:hypothetical protein
MAYGELAAKVLPIRRRGFSRLEILIGGLLGLSFGALALLFALRPLRRGASNRHNVIHRPGLVATPGREHRRAARGGGVNRLRDRNQFRGRGWDGRNGHILHRLSPHYFRDRLLCHSLPRCPGRFEVASLAVHKLTRLGATLFDATTQPLDPGTRLGCGAAETAAGPDQLERRELSPSLIAFDDSARDKVAGHRRRIEAVPAKAAGEPYPGPELTDLRHTVHG